MSLYVFTYNPVLPWHTWHQWVHSAEKKIKKRQGHYSYCAPNVTDCLTSFVHHWTNETFLKKYSRHPFSTWFLTGHPVFLYSNSKKFQYQIFNLSINIHQLARNLWFVSPISSRGEKKLNTIITTTFLNNLGNAMFGTITFVVKLSSECTIVKKRIISSSVTSNSWTKMFIVQYLSPVHNKHPLCPNHLAKTKLKIQKMQIKNK